MIQHIPESDILYTNFAKDLAIRMIDQTCRVSGRGYSVLAISAVIAEHFPVNTLGSSLAWLHKLLTFNDVNVDMLKEIRIPAHYIKYILLLSYNDDISLGAWRNIKDQNCLECTLIKFAEILHVVNTQEQFYDLLDTVLKELKLINFSNDLNEVLLELIRKAEAVLAKNPLKPIQRQIHPKGWGHEEWIVNNDLYCAKYLVVNEGKRCSIHYHRNKDETFRIVAGKVKLTVYGSDPSKNLQDLSRISVSKIMCPGDTVRIPPGLIHSFCGADTITGTSIILEISTHHEESDSYRIEKGD